MKDFLWTVTSSIHRMDGEKRLFKGLFMARFVLISSLLSAISCGVFGTKSVRYAQDNNIFSADCQPARDFWLEEIAPSVQNTCIDCQINPVRTMVLKKGTSEAVVDFNREALLKSKGYVFASSPAHQGKNAFNNLFESPDSYQSFVNNEKECLSNPEQ